LPPIYLSGGNLVLLHGTGITDAQSIIAGGISYQTAVNCGGTGSFWTITNHNISELHTAKEWATFYAKTGTSEGQKVILSFELPYITVGNLLLDGAVWVTSGPGGITYEFNSWSYETLNATMSDFKMEIVGE
jgi:hypothetical protein